MSQQSLHASDHRRRGFRKGDKHLRFAYRRGCHRLDEIAPLAVSDRYQHSVLLPQICRNHHVNGYADKSSLHESGRIAQVEHRKFWRRPRPVWLVSFRLIKSGLHRFQYYHKRTLKPTIFSHFAMEPRHVGGAHGDNLHEISSVEDLLRAHGSFCKRPEAASTEAAKRAGGIFAARAIQAAQHAANLFWFRISYSGQRTRSGYGSCRAKYRSCR